MCNTTEMFKEKVSEAKLKKIEAKESHGLEQKQMNAIVTNQMKQQSDLLEKQEIKEKELSNTVKLPKLDMMTFSGDKLRWTEFLDSFECAIHHNK